MFTSFAIGATIIAGSMVWIWLAGTLACIARTDNVRELGPAETYKTMLFWTALTSPACGIAVWLWQKALS